MRHCIICGDTYDDPYPGVRCDCGACLTHREAADEHIDVAQLRREWTARLAAAEAGEGATRPGRPADRREDRRG